MKSESNKGKTAALKQFKKWLRSEKGPGMFTVVPLSKHGYDGCSHSIMSANMHKDHIVKRNASISAKAIELGLQPADPAVNKIAVPYLDVFLNLSGGSIWTLRNKAAHMALESGVSSYLLFIDGDMEWTVGELEALRTLCQTRQDADICGGLVSTREPGRLPCVYDWDEEKKNFPRMSSLPSETEPFEVDGLGCAFTAIKLDLFREFEPIEDGWFWWQRNLGEDLFFVLRASQARYEQGKTFKIIVDPKIRPGHVGLCSFRYNDKDDAYYKAYNGLLDTLQAAIASEAKHSVSTIASQMGDSINFESRSKSDDKEMRKIRELLQPLIASVALSVREERN